MKRIVLLILLHFITFALNGQGVKLSGNVYSAATKEAIEEALIFVDASQTFASTNSEGYYELTLNKGQYDLEVLKLGSKTVYYSFELSTDTIINFNLTPLSVDLEGLEVVASKLTTGISRLKAVENFAIYESKKNEVIVLDDFAANKAANNARQVFAKVPGLNIWESDFAGLQLDIAARGLGPSRTANFNTRQNGYDMSADALGYPESYYMPAIQAIERIEVVRGAASLQYGSQFGGMLNFKLKQAPDKAIEINAEQAFGSFGLLNSFVSVGGQQNKMDYYGYYQYREGDGWRESSGFEAQTAFLNLGYQLSPQIKLGFEYSYMKYTAQQPGGVTDELFNMGELEPSLRKRNWFGVNWNLLASTVNYTISEKTRFNLKSFALFSERDALGNLQQIGVLDNPNEERTLIYDQFKNFGGEARLLHEYSIQDKASTLILGARYYKGLTKRKQGNASPSNLPEFDLLNPEDPEEFDYRFPSQNYALFVENLINLSPKLSLTSGFRMEYIQTDADGSWRLNRFDFAGNLVSSSLNIDQSSTKRWVPLLGIGSTYYLNDQLQVYANYAQNFRSITFSDLRVVNPNFQLDSLITDENGYNMDLGIRGSIGNSLKLDVSLFLLRYNDRIGQYELPGSTTLFRTNIGNSRHLGVEFFGEADLIKLFNRQTASSRLYLFLNLAMTNARYIQSDITAIQDKKVEYVPNIMLRTGLNYKVENLKATFQVSYLSEQFSDATNSTFNPNALTGIIPSYIVADLSAEYQYKRLKFSAGINNLFNEVYFTRRAESYPGPGIIPATIRSFYTSVGIRI
jgi:Fe(3+) dicitrate transport protein